MQSAGEKGGQGLRVTQHRQRALAGGVGAGRVQQGLVALLGAISVPRAGLFFGALDAQCRFKEEGHRPPELRASRESPWERSQEGEGQEWAEQGPRTQAGGSGGGRRGEGQGGEEGDVGEGPSWECGREQADRTEGLPIKPSA